MDFPSFRWPPLNVITPWHSDSLGTALRAQQQTVSLLSATSSQTQGVAKMVRYYPFRVLEEATAVKVSWMVGTTAAGNVDAGIYDWQKNRLVNTGSTAQGATSTIQTVDITDTVLPPGRYFMAITGDDATGTFFGISPNDEAGIPAIACYDETTALFGLPATAAFAPTTQTSHRVIAMGVHFNTLV